MALDIDEALEWAAGRTPAVLITIKRDGSPQSSDVAFAVIDGEIVISITDDRAKTANMRRDPRVVLHITSPAEWSYVSFSGEAVLSPVAGDPHDSTVDQLVQYFERVTGGAHPNWDEYRSAMVDDKRLVARLRPTRAVGQIRPR
ncbi:MAG: PPOX class F420-dependent oxidoreductase [Acidimicrobiales bacterium]|nr:PPOX class F420-dependent oxidoreductase [Acidimicrobiales bacterium]